MVCNIDRQKVRNDFCMGISIRNPDSRVMYKWSSEGMCNYVLGVSRIIGAGCAVDFVGDHRYDALQEQEAVHYSADLVLPLE